MNKTTATEKFKELELRICSMEQAKTLETQRLINEKVEPLLDKAKRLKYEIENSLYNEYKDILSELNKERTDIKAIIDSFKIKEANDLWYAKGTIVTLWEKSNQYRSRGNFEKTNSKGMVDIYDGSQDFGGNISSWKFPKNGDIIVRHLKKDGSIGLRFDQISEYGTLKNYFPNWCADNDTPTDNPVTRKEENEKDEES